MTTRAGGEMYWVGISITVWLILNLTYVILASRHQRSNLALENGGNDKATPLAA